MISFPNTLDIEPQIVSEKSIQHENIIENQIENETNT